MSVECLWRGEEGNGVPKDDGTGNCVIPGAC